MSLVLGSGLSRSSGVRQVSSGLTASAHPVGSLDNRRQHRFGVRLVNEDGQVSEASEQVSLIPLRAQAGTSAGAVVLSWDAPTQASLTVTGWEYRFKSGSDAWSAWQAVPGSGSSITSHTVEGLTAGVSYEFQVRAVDGATLQASSFVASGTPAGAPDAPGNLQAKADSAEVTLAWDTPSNNGSPMTGYQVRQSTDGARVGCRTGRRWPFPWARRWRTSTSTRSRV